jgi:SlyX protein
MSDLSINALNERLNELEIKFAYQQETLESLNAEVTKQWTAIDKLTRQLGIMHDQMTNMTDDGSRPADEPLPPHY